MMLELVIPKTPKQADMESRLSGRIILIPKGRRFGLTHWYAGKIIELCIDGVSPILWVDTIYGNIIRYIERAFMPVLRQLPDSCYKWRKDVNELRINVGGIKNDNTDSIIDFKSADKPENMEGFGYKYIFVNEAGIVLKNRNLWQNSILPMILDYKAIVFIGGTPKGKKIKDGYHPFYELCNEADREQYEIDNGIKEEKDRVYQKFQFSTYDNAWLDREEIDRLSEAVPYSVREQELYGRFIDSQAYQIIKREWFRYYDDVNVCADEVIISWDTASKTGKENDYSVGTVWGRKGENYYLLDMIRGRYEFPELKRIVVSEYERWRPSYVLIEDASSGTALYQELRRNTSVPLKPIKAVKDKIERLTAETPIIEAGRVYLPRAKKWIDELLGELCEFPNSEHDDIVDSVSYALNYLKSKRVEQHVYSINRYSIGRNKKIVNL